MSFDLLFFPRRFMQKRAFIKINHSLFFIISTTPRTCILIWNYFVLQLRLGMFVLWSTFCVWCCSIRVNKFIVTIALLYVYSTYRFLVNIFMNAFMSGGSPVNTFTSNKSVILWTTSCGRLMNGSQYVITEWLYFIQFLWFVYCLLLALSFVSW